LDDIQLKLNDILKVEGGVLRPLDSSNKQQPQQAEASTTGSTMDSNHDGFQLRHNDPFARAVLVQTWPESRKQRGISQLHHHQSTISTHIQRSVAIQIIEGFGSSSLMPFFLR
jgi:hypothetical protein